MLLTMRRGPRTRHPRHDEYEREVHAERGQAHCMARGDCPRSRGRHVARCFDFVLFYHPCKRYQQHAPARSSPPVAAVVPSERLGATRRPVPVDDVHLGRHVGVVPVVRRPSRLVPLPWAVAQPQGTCAACVALALGGAGLPCTHWPGTTAPRRPAAPGRRVAFRTGRRRQGRAWH